MKPGQNENTIRIRGARVHNLKDVNVDIPRNKLVVITGISGSGKSSLAFDTLYADGQRRYIESLSAYARQFLGMMEKPDVDTIEGISPAIAIDQKSVSKNPRSTVGTITEIYDYVRLLFARVGKPHCPRCKKPVARQTASQIIDQLMRLPHGKEILLLAPLVRGRKGEWKGLLEEVARAGFLRVRIDGTVHRIAETASLSIDPKKKHDIEVVVDRVEVAKDKDTKMRIASSVETALKMGKGLLLVGISRKEHDLLFSEHFACASCGISLPELEPRLFSFNSPHGACPSCTGIGYKLEFDPQFIVPNDRLSIAEGAIRPWMHASHRVGRQSWYWWQLNDLAEAAGFSLTKAWKDLPSEFQYIILHGTEAARSKFKNQSADWRTKIKDSDEGGFEGVMPNLMRRYKETDSDFTRQELEQYMRTRLCEACEGKRLRPEALAVTVADTPVDAISAFTIHQAQKYFAALVSQHAQLTPNELKIAKPIIKEVLNRLGFLVSVGLDYLTLERSSTTLAGGEAQRIRLATQIGTKLVGVLYILDEPSIGLHPRDQRRLIETLKELRDLGNTVVVVEHDPETVRASDWVIDVGPGAGKHGGRIVFEGEPKQLFQAKTLTAEYVSGKRRIERTTKASPETEKYLVIRGARQHNLKNIDASIPLGKFVCITGVSGSGKSTLMDDILARALARNFFGSREEPGAHDTIEGLGYIDKAVVVDQSPIGRTPRSNPATYTGAFSFIRDLFASTQEARIRGYAPGRFSFNVKGGRCEACQGEGMQQIEMHFLPDVWVECGECHGTRYNKETLEVEYRGKNIAELLAMTVEEASEFFKDITGLSAKLRTLAEVGLGYITLGQPATTISGGEAQRVKLATELSRRATGKTLYILDEPTTGLHPYDIEKLLKLLLALVEKGNTVLVIEHNLDIIKNADWIIDLGPEGGDGGGRIVAEGVPDDIARNTKSYTGYFLKKSR